MLKFSTQFPYLDQIEKGSASVKKVDITLPRSKRIIGYFVKFRLKIVETFTNFTSMSEQKIFIYYSNVSVYITHCFPTSFNTAPPW